MNYEEFKNKILNLFINDSEVIYEQDYTKKEKQEFIDNNTFDYHQAYERECKEYGGGDKTVFQDDNLKTYLLNLSFECHLYHQIKKQPMQENKNTEYPMTLDEFTEKVTEELIKDCNKIYGDSRETTLKDLDEALSEDSTLISAEYIGYCDIYDNVTDRNELPKNYPFDNLSNAVYAIRTWMYF